MKTFRFAIVAFSFLLLISSCRAWNSVFKPKYGCPTNGKNVDAAKLVNEDPKAAKQARKAKKFKS
jgi:hypothetical protein